jgi:glycerophosphoryl diester phosphodiesterase
VAAVGLVPTVAPGLGASDEGDPSRLIVVRASAPAACERDQVLLTAHRGTGAGTRAIRGHTFSENTLPAFTEALDAGADGVEADYWPTADGRVATQHDDTLDRMTDAHGRIDRLSWAEVAKAKVSGGARVPSFEEVVMAVRARGGHRQQEIKQGAMFTQRLLQRMVRTDVTGETEPYERLLYTSSEMRTLRRIHALDPRLPVGLITRSATGRPALERLPAWLDVVLVDLRAADVDYVRRAADRGYAVSLRGVESVAQLHEAVSLGATRVLTNHPEVVGRVC